MFNLWQIQTETKSIKSLGMQVALFPLFGILISIPLSVLAFFYHEKIWLLALLSVIIFAFWIYSLIVLILASVASFKLRRLSDFVRMKYPNEAGIYSPTAPGTMFIVGWALTLFLVGGLILWIAAIVLVVKANEFIRIIETINFNENNKNNEVTTSESK